MRSSSEGYGHGCPYWALGQNPRLATGPPLYDRDHFKTSGPKIGLYKIPPMPFTIEEFLSVFRQYNLDVWPIQVFLIFLAIILIVLVHREKPTPSRIINIILGSFWLWMGVVYHILYFSEINKAAYIFGLLFIAQALLFGYLALYYKQGIIYGRPSSMKSILGWVFMGYALLAYPVLAVAFGHSYPEMPTFGLPCPTTIFTFGLLMFSVNRIPRYIVVIPFFWSLLGFSAAMSLGILEDTGLVIAGVVGAAVLLFHKGEG